MESPIKNPIGPTNIPKTSPKNPPIIKDIIMAIIVTNIACFLSNFALYQAIGNGTINDVIKPTNGTYTDIANKNSK